MITKENYSCDTLIQKFIQDYGKVAYISQTENPKGIVIVIYENGISVDLDIRKKVTKLECEKGVCFGEEFSKECIGDEQERYLNYPLKEGDDWHHTARLFHRSLIKYLSGKRKIGISVLEEIFDYLNDKNVPVTTRTNKYAVDMKIVFEVYSANYKFSAAYQKILIELIENLSISPNRKH